MTLLLIIPAVIIAILAIYLLIIWILLPIRINEIVSLLREILVEMRKENDKT